MPGCESRSLSDSRSKMRARPRRTLHPPSGGAAAPRLFDRITVAGAPKPDQGVRPTRRKPVNCHDRGGAPAVVPGTHAAEGQIRRLDTRPDHRRYAHTARHRQSSGGLHQHRQDPLIMPDLERRSRSTAIRRNKRRTAAVRALLQTRTDYEGWQGASRLRAAEYLLYADGDFAATGGHRTTSSGAVAQSLR